MSSVNNKNLTQNDEIDLGEIFQTIIEGKWVILFITSIFLIISLFYSLSLPNIYQSNAILSPVGEHNSANNILNGSTGLASLAGINLQSQNSDSNSLQAMEKLNTLSFFRDNLMPNIFLPDLMAYQSWEPSTNEGLYDKEIFNSDKNIWIKGSKYEHTNIPTAQESHTVFIRDHLSIRKNKDTGFVTISIRHQSPFIAKSWTELIVNELNNFYRDKDKLEFEAAVKYLNKQITQTSLTEVKQVIAQLLQQKTQQLTLIEVNNFYVFEYIDPPVVMELKSEPRRSVICIFGAFFGFIFGIFIVIIRKYLLK